MKRRQIVRRFGDMREFYATYSIKHLMQSEVDFLQGRTSATVFMRNYFNPVWIKDLKRRSIRNACNMLKLVEAP